MRFSVQKGRLQKVLAVVERVVPKRGAQPQEYAAFFSTRIDGEVRVSAMAGDVVYSTLLPAEVADVGSEAIPAAELIAAVTAAPSDSIAFDGLTVRAGTASWEISPLTGVGGDMAPISSPEINPVSEVVLPLDDFVSALEAVRYAVARTSNRPSLQQIHFGEGRAVAGDGRRLHQVSVAADHAFDVPESLVEVLLDAVAADPSSEAGSITVMVWEGFMGFQFGSTSLLSGALNYEFPPVDELTIEPARAQSQTLRVSVSDFLTALKVARVADDLVEVAVSEGSVLVRSASARGSAEMTIAAETQAGWIGAVLAPSLEELLGNVGDGTASVDLAIPARGQAGFLFWESESALALVATVRNRAEVATEIAAAREDVEGE